MSSLNSLLREIYNVISLVLQGYGIKALVIILVSYFINRIQFYLFGNDENIMLRLTVGILQIATVIYALELLIIQVQKVVIESKKLAGLLGTAKKGSEIYMVEGGKSDENYPC